MSKLSKWLKSDGGDAVKDLAIGAAIGYAKKQSSDFRKVAPVVETVLQINQAVKDSGSKDVLKDTVYATAQSGVLDQAPQIATPNIVPSGEDMNPLDFAMNTIRAGWWQRLTDRTFLSMVAGVFTAAGACIAAWRTDGMPLNEKMNLTYATFAAITALIGWWNQQEKSKDKAIGTAAIEAMSPPLVINQPMSAVITPDEAERLQMQAVIDQEAASADNQP